MNKPIPAEIDNPLNKEVLNELKGKSCHSDIVEPIESYLSVLKDVNSFCPDGSSFSYILWYVNSVVFAYASGMQNVYIRLSQNGDLNLSAAKNPKSFRRENSWYAVPYNSNNLELLVNSAYESAKNS